MACEADLPCYSGIITPLERDPVPINKKVYKDIIRGFPNLPLTPTNTLKAVVETIWGMPPIIGEDFRVTQTKAGYASILAERKMKDLISCGEFSLNSGSAETP